MFKRYGGPYSRSMSGSGKRRRCPDERIGSEAEFQRLLANERRRSERSGRPFVILTVHLPAAMRPSKEKLARDRVLSTVCQALRGTDWIAWCEDEAVIGVLCTETGASDAQTSGTTIAARLHELLAIQLPVKLAAQVEISFETSGGAPPRAQESHKILSY